MRMHSNQPEAATRFGYFPKTIVFALVGVGLTLPWLPIALWPP